VTEVDTFTFKQVPGIQRLGPGDSPRRRPPRPDGPGIGSVAMDDGGDDGGDDGPGYDSPEYGLDTSFQVSPYAGSRASTPELPRELPPWNTRVRPPAPRFTVPDLSPRSLAAAQARERRESSARQREIRAHEAELDAMAARARAERSPAPGPRGRRRAPEGLAPPRGAVIEARRARAFREASPAPVAPSPRRSARPRTPRLVSPAFGGMPAGKGWSPEQHDWVGSGFLTSY
jgi:hypothetical protein